MNVPQFLTYLIIFIHSFVGIRQTPTPHIDLKKEKVRRIQFKTQEEARLNIFQYIEMFYNPKRRHTANGRFSPAEYEIVILGR